MKLETITHALAPQELAKKPGDLYKAKLLYGALTTIAAVGTLFAARSRRILLAVASGALTTIGLSVLQRLFSFVPSNLKERFANIERQIEDFPGKDIMWLPLHDLASATPGKAIAYTLKRPPYENELPSAPIMRFIATKKSDTSAMIEVLPLDEASGTYQQALSILSNFNALPTIEFAPDANLNEKVFSAILKKRDPRACTVAEAVQDFTATYHPTSDKHRNNYVFETRLSQVKHRGKEVQVFCDQAVASLRLTGNDDYANTFSITLFDQTRYRKLSFDFSPSDGTRCTEENFKSDINFKQLIERAIDDFTNSERSYEA